MKNTPERYYLEKDYNRREVKGQRNHYVSKLYSESRWPYTSVLTPQQIVCMRDDYCGKRRFPSVVQRRPDYERLFHPVQGWDHRTHKDVRFFYKDIQISARDEDKHRNVVVGINSIYGKHRHLFMDIANNNYPHHERMKHFYRGHIAGELPPIRYLESLPRPA